MVCVLIITSVSGITGWYQLVPRTVYESTVPGIMYEYISYLQVPEVHL